MNKEEWITVGIKLFGVFLIVMAIVKLPESISVIYNYSMLYDFCDSEVGVVSGTPEALKMSEAICNTAPANFLNAVATIIIYILSGLYFIKSGRLAKRILGS